MPSSMLQTAAPVLYEADAVPHVSDEFLDIAGETATASSDGSGPITRNMRFKRVGAGGAVAVLVKEPDGKYKCTRIGHLFAMVPGKQTVPRAELWACICILMTMHVILKLAIIVDATYVINGAKVNFRKRFLKGTNKDLWKQLFDLLETRTAEGKTTLFRCIPSHVKAAGVRNGLPAQDIFLDELADEAAGKGNPASYALAEADKKDEHLYNMQKQICTRIAAIEAYIRKHDLGPEQRADDIFEKAAARTQTYVRHTGMVASLAVITHLKCNGHRFEWQDVADSGRAPKAVKCKRCWRRAGPNNVKYRLHHKCLGHDPADLRHATALEVTGRTDEEEQSPNRRQYGDEGDDEVAESIDGLASTASTEAMPCGRCNSDIEEPILMCCSCRAVDCRRCRTYELCPLCVAWHCTEYLKAHLQTCGISTSKDTDGPGACTTLAVWTPLWHPTAETWEEHQREGLVELLEAEAAGLTVHWGRWRSAKTAREWLTHQDIANRHAVKERVTAGHPRTVICDSVASGHSGSERQHRHPLVRTSTDARTSHAASRRKGAARFPVQGLDRVEGREQDDFFGAEEEAATDSIQQGREWHASPEGRRLPAAVTERGEAAFAEAIAAGVRPVAAAITASKAKATRHPIDRRDRSGNWQAEAAPHLGPPTEEEEHWPLELERYSLPKQTRASLTQAGIASRALEAAERQKAKVTQVKAFRKAITAARQDTSHVGDLISIPVEAGHPLYDTHPSHSLWHAGGYTFCDKCGKRSSTCRTLHKPCTPATQGSSVAEDNRHRGSKAVIARFFARKTRTGRSIWANGVPPTEAIFPARVTLVYS